MPKKRELHDRYFKQAKEEGYAARSAYKLKQIDERRKVLRRGDRVLDLGCAPGSWLQVASEAVGPKGRVVGLDLQPVSVDAGPNTVTFVGDAFNFPVEKLRQAVGDDLPRAPDAPPQPPFDVVLSDMAPNTTGTPAGDHLRSVAVCRRVLEIVPQVLRPGGDLVMKIFEGEAYMDVVREAAALFREAKGYKPPATREVSREMFILAFGYKGAAVVQGPRDPGLAPRRVAPGPGWGGAGGGGGGGRA